MPPTISARVDEEKIEELKNLTDADADSEAIRAAVDYAVRERRQHSAYLGIFMTLLFLTFEAYGEISVPRESGPVLLLALVGVYLLPKLMRFYHNWTN